MALLSPARIRALLPVSLGALVLPLAISLTPASASAGAAGLTGETVEGVVDVMAVDHHLPEAGEPHGGHEEGALTTTTVLRTSTGVVPVPGSLAPGLKRGQRVRATTGGGARGGYSTAPVVTSVTPLAAAATTPGYAAGGSGAGSYATWTSTGRHSLTVLPVYWTASRPQSPSADTLGSLADRTAAYWSAQSAGQLTVTTKVAAWQRISAPSGCDYAEIMKRALSVNKLAAPGTNQHVLVYFPTLAACDWAGLGSIGGPNIWVNGYPLTDVFSHEFGHNLGIGHANTRQCVTGSGRVSLSASCSDQAYADSADVMGFATYAASSGTLNSALADALGMLRSVQPPASGTSEVTLFPLTGAGQVRAVKIPVTGGTVYLDYRPNVAPDTRRSAWAGIQAHFRPSGSATPTSYLLDMQPWTATPFGSASMPASSVWRVPLNAGVAVSVISTGSTARLRLARTASDITPPSAPEVTYEARTANAGAVTWTPSHDAGSGIAGYRVLANNATAGFAGPSASTFGVSWAAPVTAIRVEAVDAAGNTARSADPLNATSRIETSAYSAPVGTPMVRTPGSGAAVRTRSVNLTWAAPSGGGSVNGYQVYVNGRPIGGVRSAATRALGLTLGNGPATLSVAARGVNGKLGKVAARTITVDTVAPGKPGKPRLNKARRTLSWKRAADRGTPVRFEIRARNKVLVTTWSASAKLSVAQYRAVRAAKGATVEAVDRAGNRSGKVKLRV